MIQQATLIDRFARHDAHVAIIGLGYVGLPLAIAVDQTTTPTTGQACAALPGR